MCLCWLWVYIAFEYCKFIWISFLVQFFKTNSHLQKRFILFPVQFSIWMQTLNHFGQHKCRKGPLDFIHLNWLKIVIWWGHFMFMHFNNISFLHFCLFLWHFNCKMLHILDPLKSNRASFFFVCSLLSNNSSIRRIKVVYSNDGCCLLVCFSAKWMFKIHFFYSIILIILFIWFY